MLGVARCSRCGGEISSVPINPAAPIPELRGWPWWFALERDAAAHVCPTEIDPAERRAADYARVMLDMPPAPAKRDELAELLVEVEEALDRGDGVDALALLRRAHVMGVLRRRRR